MKKLFFLLLGSTMAQASVIPLESSAKPKEKEEILVFQEVEMADFENTKLILEYNREIIFIESLEPKAHPIEKILKKLEKADVLHLLPDDKLLRRINTDSYITAQNQKKPNLLNFLPDDKLLRKKFKKVRKNAEQRN